MKRTMPATPFSTPLSRSAKETEGRIRNIFTGKRKRPALLLMLAVLAVIVLCGSLVVFVPRRDAEADAPPAETDTPPTEHPEWELVITDGSLDLSSLLKQPEYFTREVGGVETTFYRYEGDGWAIDVPADWSPDTFYDGWRAPSENAAFGVHPSSISAQTQRAYWASMGSWAYRTDLPAPFDEYYDGGLHEVQPDDTARYECYAFPVSDNQSYQLICCGVWGRTGEADWDLLHAMLQSFTVDESLHSVRAEPYTEGYSELEAALAGLADPQNPVCLMVTIGNYGYNRDGRAGTDGLQYADALRNFEYTLVGRVDEGPLPEDLRDRNQICLHMSGIGCNLYAYKDSNLVGLHWRGADYRFTAADPAQPGVSPYEAAYAWFQATTAENPATQAVLDFVDRLFVSDSVDMRYWLLPGTGPVSADLKLYYQNVRDIFARYDWVEVDEYAYREERDRSQGYTLYLMSSGNGPSAIRGNLIAHSDSAWITISLSESDGLHNTYYRIADGSTDLVQSLSDLWDAPTFRHALITLPETLTAGQELADAYTDAFRELYLSSGAILDYELRSLELRYGAEGETDASFIMCYAVKPINPDAPCWQSYAPYFTLSEDGWIEFTFLITLTVADGEWCCGWYEWNI